MKFWIVTPSYNQIEWLRLCIASVADQAIDGIEVHHHIQDAQSSDGTPEWLAEYVAQQPSTTNYQLTFASEADEGMYDAINRGWKLAPDDVDVIAHLNCDEQYLPGALQTIAAFMKTHPKTDVVLADMIVVGSEGNYICHRRSLNPYAFTSRYCCGGFTATTFQRASVTQGMGVFFDASWRNFGDKVWYNALHKAGCRFSVCHEFVSLFTDTGANLNWTEEGFQEKQRYEDEFLKGSGKGTVLIARMNGFRRALKEFTLRSPEAFRMHQSAGRERVTVPIVHPRGLWHKKWVK
jgi:glycosyltransferase involved in cell wall biosynthesis